MLSDNQIKQLRERKEELRVDLNDLIERYGIESESSIDKELRDEQSKKDKSEDCLDLIEGLKEAQKFNNLATLIQSWIDTRQVDRVKHKNHEELKRVGFIFSPRNGTLQTSKPLDPDE
jgi:hypothetical protein